MKINKIISLLLSFLIVFSITGCNNPNPDTSNHQVPDNTFIPNENIIVDEGLHIFNSTESNEKIIDNGICDYAVVIPEICSSFIESASTEFINFFNKSTGIILNVFRDNEVTFSSESKFFVFGNVSFVKRAKHEFDLSLVNSSGYIITTQNKSVFVIGGGDVGVLNGVYELLHQLIDWRIYAEDTIYFDKNIKDLKMQNFSICDSPDVEFNMSSYRSVGYGNAKLAHRFRTYIDSEIWIPGTGCHCVFQLLDPEVYAKEHSAWYAGQQLCYTAHGNEEEFEQMVSTMVEALKAKIDAYPEINNVSVTQRDHNSWCNCDACTKLTEKYGSCAATQIIFINEVAKRIESWLNTERNGRKVNIAIFAYHKTESAPTFVDENIILRDNVSVWFAPASISFTSSIYSQENIPTYENFKLWSKITKSIYLWFYDVNYTAYLIPNNTVHCKKDWYKAAKQFGAKYLFNQGIYDSVQCGAFTNLKGWLNSKYGWNAGYDHNSLMKEYFDNYFGPASDLMRKYFDELETNLFIYNDKMSGIYSASKDPSYWSPNLLQQWMDYINQAYQTLEPLKELDKNLYDIYKKHIDIESISVRFMIYEMYPYILKEEELKVFKSELATDLDRLGITNIREGGGGTADYIMKLLKNN